MRWTTCAAWLLLLVPGGVRAQSGEDALSFLERVTKHYRDADSLHVEVMEETSTHNDYTDSHSHSRLSAYTASCGRFRYEGWDSSGSGLIISDGTSEWRLLRSFAEYAKAPAGAYFKGRVMIAGDDRSVVEARDVLQGFNFLDANLRAAHYDKSETLRVGGRKVRCTVVEFGTPDSTQKQTANAGTFETTLWIDPVLLTLVQERRVSHSKPYYGSAPAPMGQGIDFVKTTMYAVTEIDFKPDADTFAFHAPAGSEERAKLPSPFLVLTNQRDPLADADTAAKKHADGFLGKPLPPLVVGRAGGGTTSLASFKGHPLLVDIWATWCGPCLIDLPVLQKIRDSTKGTDLVVIGIDEDSEPSDAVEFLKRRGYGWQNFHFDHALIQQLGVESIPLIILVDAEGKIVYYHSGADDKALKEAIASLGGAYRQVQSDR